MALSKFLAKDSFVLYFISTVKFGDKERFDKEQIGAKEPFPVTKCQLLHKDRELLAF